MAVNETTLQDCARGDRKAQYRLYQLCYPILMSVCCRYRKDRSDAVAMLNAGFLKIINSLAQYRRETPFEAWARRIMINTLIDDYRAHVRKQDLVEYNGQLEQFAQEDLVDYNRADQQFDAAHLEAMVQQLPPVSKQVFNLFAIDGFSHKEISAMLQISEGTSKWHLHFARTRLQELLLREQPGRVLQHKEINNP